MMGQQQRDKQQLLIGPQTYDDNCDEWNGGMGSGFSLSLSPHEISENKQRDGPLPLARTAALKTRQICNQTQTSSHRHVSWIFLCTVLVISLYLLLHTDSSTLPAGSPDWVVAVNSKYFFSPPEDKKTFSEATTLCITKGGHLATLETLTEFYWMKGYRSSLAALRFETFWVGGRRDEQDIWRWIALSDAPAFSYSKWVVNQPDNGHGIQNCATVIGQTAYWKEHLQPQDMFGFDDSNCDFRQRYICEFD